MQSLQKELLENIRQAFPNSRSLDDLLAIGTLLGHKDSLTERKLRILVHSGLVEVIKDERGYNKAYKTLEFITGQYPPMGSTLRLSEIIPPKTQEPLIGLNLPRIF